MLAFVGDVHGKFQHLNTVLASIPAEATVIQVGDFGAWPQPAPVISRPVYFIDGNHEYFPWLKELQEPTQIWHNATYVPRGTVLELAGFRVGFLGGGESVDKVWRTPGFNWLPEESITQKDAERLLVNAQGGLDVLVTHVPPISVFRGLLAGRTTYESATWSSKVVEHVWRELGYPQLYCGHMHQSARGPKYRVLDINEVDVFVPVAQQDSAALS